MKPITDRVVKCQLTRALRAASLLQIGRRRRQRDLLDARADGNGDHVLFQRGAISDACIASRRDDIDQIVLDHDLDLHLRMFVLKFCKKRRQDIRHDGAGNVQLQPTPYPTCGIRRFHTGLVHLGQKWSNAVGQGTALFSGSDASRCAHEKRRTECGLDPRNCGADLRRRDAQTFGCRSEAAFVENR